MKKLLLLILLLTACSADKKEEQPKTETKQKEVVQKELVEEDYIKRKLPQPTEQDINLDGNELKPYFLNHFSIKREESGFEPEAETSIKYFLESRSFKKQIILTESIYGLGEYLSITIPESSISEVFSLVQKLYPAFEKFKLENTEATASENNVYGKMNFEDKFEYIPKIDKNGEIKRLTLKHSGIGPSYVKIEIIDLGNEILVKYSFETT